MNKGMSKGIPLFFEYNIGELDISNILTVLIVNTLQTPPLFIEGVPVGRGRYKRSA